MNPLTGRFQEIAALIARFAREDQEYSTAIGNLFFNRRSSPTQPLHVAQWPCFALVAQGAKSITVGTESFHYGVGNFLLVSLDLPVVSRVVQASTEVPHLGLGMAIDSAALADLMSRISVPRQALATEGMLGVAVNTASEALLDATLRLLRLLEQPDTIPALAPLIEQEILYHLLMGPCGPRLLQIAQADSPSNKIAKAIAWLRRHYTEQLRVDELAAHVGMSVSSLHHHFKAVAAMTPMQYQKQLRLHEARRLMLVEQRDVGHAGYSVGYQSPSQFSREYSRLYGLPPLKDVERARATQA
ncbi:AraC family transcriptional regulator N-terminal domain-containing protein [Undibacterium sp. TJN25]|uniref:AraC family transcriptional regulator n=1 Tax=Undibacterium sp. TJN25 TaxID=3413056 RepID=UPI003BF06549